MMVAVAVDLVTCPECRGSGTDLIWYPVEREQREEACQRCEGAGQVEDGARQEVNRLMRRCMTAMEKCEDRSGDFTISYSTPTPEWPWPWRVGFYERDQGKQIADDVTLSAALRRWLATHEHRWD